ncbi:MAG: hypothetical protein L6V93_10375 [Clostridiales bacterium]|nr:MAG: hypothetical protein L6V93_10375 [Clostridiales bacterium]
MIKRSSAAKIVNNMLGREADIEYINAHRDGITLFDDVPSWEWYCGDVAEASNTHGFEKLTARKAGNKQYSVKKYQKKILLFL